MGITYTLRKKLINLTGYWFYKRAHLPIGADFLEDISNKLGIQPKIIFDVGANYGQTAAYYSANFPDAQIYSFEPIQNSFTKLIENTTNLNNVKCFHTAFGEKETNVEISLFEEEQSQLNSLKNVNTNLDSNAPKETISVTTIDLFLESNNIETLDLLKIDTEGYEIEVLKGAKKSLQTGKINMMLCEVALSFANERNTQLSDLINYLKPYNFTLIGMYDTNINYLNQGLTYSNILLVKTSYKN